MQVGIIINPVAGPRGQRAAEARRRLGTELLAEARLNGEVRLTTGRGSAGDIANDMVANGATTVVAWGGDGTINEVATVAAETGVALGVVPGGSGNGFARGLGLAREPRAALWTALTGVERAIDMGAVAGRRFVNVTGVGLDAHLATVFNQLTTRGRWAYLAAGVRELSSYRASTYTVRVASLEFTMEALLLTVANGPEYGSGAIIAPTARVDDGALDLVCVPSQSMLALVWHARRLFTGTIDRVPGVRLVAASAIEIAADHPLLFHVDGEVVQGPNCLRIAVDRSALRVRVPPHR